jgi:hypothetical protein
MSGMIVDYLSMTNTYWLTISYDGYWGIVEYNLLLDFLKTIVFSIVDMSPEP